MNALQSARMIVQAGLNRSLASLNKYISDETLELSDIYTYSEAKDHSDNLANLLETTVDGVTYFETADYSSDEGPHWQYLPENFALDSEPITGRFAYLVIAQSGKLDLSASIDNGFYVDSPNNNAVSEGSYISDRTSLKSDGINYVLGRPGKNINELFLDTLDTNWLTASYLQQISSYFASPRGKLKGTDNTWKAQWDDFTTLFTSLQINDNDEKENFRTYFSIGNSPDPEAFWVDDGDKNRESSEFLKRFQLNRTDWDDITVDSIKNIPILNTSSENNHGILWFNNWKSAGGMGEVVNCQNQVIANLIDYNDTDNNATTDDENNPTYVGLEAVPYTNEVCLDIPVTINKTLLTSSDLTDYEQPYIDVTMQTDSEAGLLINYYDQNNYSGETYYKYEFTINKPKMILELINLYSVSGAIPTNANVQLSIGFLFGDKDNPGEYDYLDEELDFVFDNDTANCYIFTSNEYEYMEKEFSTFSKPITVIDEEYYDNPVLYAFINHIKVKVSEYTSSVTPDFYDYSYVVDSDEPDSFIVMEGVGSNTYQLNYQVQDSRQNLLDTDWEQDNPQTISGELYDPSDREDLSLNSNYPTNTYRDTNSTTMDHEYYNDSVNDDGKPYDLSTTYIRNAPMQSPWELGFIHRGEAWQTLNLKKYNMTEWDAGDSGGGNNYEDGDANLLDQIKMTSDTLTQGKVNINSQIEETLKVLFEKIEVGTNITNTEGSGNEDWTGTHAVDAVDANNLAVEIKTITSAVDGEFLTRAQILRPDNGIPLLYNDSLGLNQETDATQEELIGKFINLCKTTQQNTFYIIVIAQKIKDVGIAGQTLTLTKDGNKDGITTTVPVKMGRYDSDGDEILSTKKLFAIVKYTGSKFYIHFLKYLDN